MGMHLTGTHSYHTSTPCCPTAALMLHACCMRLLVIGWHSCRQVHYATLPAVCCYHLQQATHQYLRWGCISKQAGALCQPHCLLTDGRRYAGALHCGRGYANHACKAPGCGLDTWSATGSSPPPHDSLHLSDMPALVPPAAIATCGTPRCWAPGSLCSLCCSAAASLQQRSTSAQEPGQPAGNSRSLCVHHNMPQPIAAYGISSLAAFVGRSCAQGWYSYSATNPLY
jgi:hypothetical protein